LEYIVKKNSTWPAAEEKFSLDIIRKIWNALPFPDQTKRLLIIFVFFITGWLVVRHHLVPPTFGQRGYYRAAAVDSIAALPISFVGQSQCVECHVDEGAVKTASYHRDVSCEVCHGPGAKHLDDPSANSLLPAKERTLCTVCHSYTASKPTGFPQIEPLTHNPADPCIKCHNPHDPKPPTTPSACGACHGEIARTKSVSHHASLECTFCHQTQELHKISPRAAIPGKPANRDFCGGCHSRSVDSPKEIPRVDMDSHGDGHLCWQCHYPHYPEAL